MHRLRILTLLAATALAGTAFASAARAEVVLKLLVDHTDAFSENFNPYNYGGPANIVQDFVYEPLWIYNVWHPDQDFPALATSYEFNADLTEITYHLREGVKWSDGEPFTADDVVFTYSYNVAHPDFQIGFDLYNKESDAGSLIGVEKIDDHTVTFKMNRPNSLAHMSIGIIMPLPEHIWSKVEDPRNFANPTPVATGPFTAITDFSRSSFKICRNELYRDNATNKIDCLQYPQLSTNEQVIAAVSAGDLDWAGDGITDPEITFTPKSEYNHYWLPPEGNVNLLLNTTRKPFDNLEFRKAVSMAIDRDTLVEVSTFELTTPTLYPIGSGELYKDWYDPAALAPYKYLMAYDPTAAKAVLDAAGFVDKDGDGWRDNLDGTPITFNIEVPSGWTDWVNSVQTISENLQDIGVNASLQTPEEGAWFETIATGNMDAYMMWTETSSTPWVTYDRMFSPRNMIPGQIDAQGLHQMRIPEIEALLAKAALTADKAQQKAEIQAVQLIVAEKLPVISLFSNPSWYEYSTRNFTGWVNADDPRHRPMVNGGIHERVKHVLSLVPVAK